MNKMREKTHITNIINEKEIITADSIEYKDYKTIKKIL